MTTFSGSGPGAQTRDGCSVELYRRKPYRGELDIPASRLSPGSTVLELGCGAGQGSRALLDRGFRVTAVDNSKEMLAHAPADVTAVCADIETLDLQQHFDAVILPTGLINHAQASAREGFVACARRHLEPGGWFFVERQNPVWLKTAAAGDVNRSAGLDIHTDAVRREGRFVAMTLRYTTQEATWSHSFQLTVLEDQELQELLARSGFAALEWLNNSASWLRVQSLPKGFRG